MWPCARKKPSFKINHQSLEVGSPQASASLFFVPSVPSPLQELCISPVCPISSTAFGHQLMKVGTKALHPRGDCELYHRVGRCLQGSARTGEVWRTLMPPDLELLGPVGRARSPTVQLSLLSGLIPKSLKIATTIQ